MDHEELCNWLINRDFEAQMHRPYVKQAQPKKKQYKPRLKADALLLLAHQDPIFRSMVTQFHVLPKSTPSTVDDNLRDTTPRESALETRQSANERASPFASHSTTAGDEVPPLEGRPDEHSQPWDPLSTSLQLSPNSAVGSFDSSLLDPALRETDSSMTSFQVSRNSAAGSSDCSLLDPAPRETASGHWNKPNQHPFAVAV